MSARTQKIFSDWLGQGRSSTFPEVPAHIDELLFSFLSEDKFTDASALETPVDDFLFAESRKLGLQPKAFWPENQPYAFCSTHDIDRILSSYHGFRGFSSHPIKSICRVSRDLTTFLGRNRWEKNPFFNFKRAAAAQSELGIRAAYYVLFEKRRVLKSLLNREIQHTVGVYQPDSIRDELVALEVAGHEIGIHASFDAWQGDFKSIQNLKHERSQLRELGLNSACGIRNHYLQYAHDQTPQGQVAAGFSYDSTYGFNSKNGFRSGTSFPYRCNGIWELPFQVMDSSLRSQARTPAEWTQIAHRALDQVRQKGGVFVLNWHLHTLNEEIFPNEFKLYQELVRIAKKDGAWIALPRDVIEWWERRSKS